MFMETPLCGKNSLMLIETKLKIPILFTWGKFLPSQNKNGYEGVKKSEKDNISF